MDWKKLGRKIIGVGAPLLGSVVAGSAGEKVGTLVARTLGCKNDPEIISKALDTDPDAAIKLRQLELDHDKELKKIQLREVELATEERINQITQVNQTMRDESKSEHWPQYSWRPFWGFASGFAFVAVVIFICIIAYEAVSSGDAAKTKCDPYGYCSFYYIVWCPWCNSWNRGTWAQQIKTTKC
jgi:hypothetical protein